MKTLDKIMVLSTLKASRRINLSKRGVKRNLVDDVNDDVHKNRFYVFYNKLNRNLNFNHLKLIHMQHFILHILNILLYV